MTTLIHICKRLAYSCPVIHISDTFYTLLKLNEHKVKYISDLTNQINNLTTNEDSNEETKLEEFQLKEV